MSRPRTWLSEVFGMLFPLLHFLNNYALNLFYFIFRAWWCIKSCWDVKRMPWKYRKLSLSKNVDKVLKQQMCSDLHLQIKVKKKKSNTVVFSHTYVACLKCGSHAPVHSYLTTPVLMFYLCSDQVWDILTTYQLFHNLTQQTVWETKGTFISLSEVETRGRKMGVFWLFRLIGFMWMATGMPRF